jgi:hypothetical protein
MWLKQYHKPSPMDGINHQKWGGNGIVLTTLVTVDDTPSHPTFSGL